MSGSGLRNPSEVAASAITGATLGLADYAPAIADIKALVDGMEDMPAKEEILALMPPFVNKVNEYVDAANKLKKEAEKVPDIMARMASKTSQATSEVKMPKSDVNVGTINEGDLA